MYNIHVMLLSGAHTQYTILAIIMIMHAKKRDGPIKRTAEKVTESSPLCFETIGGKK